MNKAEQIANHEIGWWKAHHRKDKEKLMEEMAKLYVLLFGISNEDAKIVVKHRVGAAELHNRAEEYEDQGNQKKADIYWGKTEESLRQHFTLLEKLRER